MIRVRTIFTGVPGTPWYSNQFFATGIEDAQAAVDTVGGFWSAIDGAMRNTVSWATEPQVAVIQPSDGSLLGVVNTDSAGGFGGSSGDMVPVAAQALVRMNTGIFLGGRQIRGAIYVPGLDVGTDDGNGQILASFVDELLAAAEAMVTTPGNATPGVWSRKHGDIWDVDSFTVTSKWAVLRSRRD